MLSDELNLFSYLCAALSVDNLDTEIRPSLWVWGLYHCNIMEEGLKQDAAKRPLWWRPWCVSDWQRLVITGCGLVGLSEGKWCKTVALCLVALLGPMPVAPLNEMKRLACLLAGWVVSWWTGWLPCWLAGRQTTVVLKLLTNLSFLLLLLPWSSKSMGSVLGHGLLVKFKTKNYSWHQLFKYIT